MNPYGKIFVIPLGVYTILLLFTFFRDPSGIDGFVDTSKSSTSYLHHETKLIAHSASSLLSKKSDHIVLLGASNMTEMFDVETINQSLNEKLLVHNFGISAGRLSDFDVMLDLILPRDDAIKQRPIVFIIGTYYKMFQVDGTGGLGWKNAWYSLREQSRMWEELEHSSLHKLTDGRYEPRYSPTVTAFMSFLTRPLELLRNSLKTVFKFRRTQYSADFTCSADVQRELSVEPFHRRTLVIGQAEFNNLIELSKRITSAGHELIILDLPQVDCLQDVNTSWRQYNIEKEKPFKQLASFEKVSINNLQEYSNSNFFFDPTHTNEEGRKFFTKFLYELIKAKPPQSDN